MKYYANVGSLHSNGDISENIMLSEKNNKNSYFFIVYITDVSFT